MPKPVPVPEPRKLRRREAIALIRRVVPDTLRTDPETTKRAIAVARLSYLTGWRNAAIAHTEAVAEETQCPSALTETIRCIKDDGHDSEHFALLSGMSPPTAVRWSNHALDGELSAP